MQQRKASDEPHKSPKEESNIHLVDFKGERHKERFKDLISEACNQAEIHHSAISGYALVTWDDSGYFSTSIHYGGTVNHSRIRDFVDKALERALLS